jgi:precorrin-8X/cobalt-precorrin-8 methylmutase
MSVDNPLSVSEKRPFVLDLYEHPMSGEAVEARSFAIIDQECAAHGFADEEWQVVRRMLHTSADFSLMHQVRFSPGAVEASASALRAGRPIFVDSQMIRSGLSLQRLRQVCPAYGPERLVCHVADPDVAAEAREKGLPRSLFAVRKARSILDGGIAVFGNAPVALLELNRMIIEDRVRPALVVAMPVGFVHVCESKEELMSLGVPYVAIEGRRGGSPLAVATIHALCALAA